MSIRTLKTDKTLALTKFRNISPISILFRSFSSVRLCHKGSKMDGVPGFLQKKEKFLAMSKEERRRLFKPKAIVTLDNIEVWSTYYKNHRDKLQKLDKSAYISQFSVVIPEHNSNLNEIVSIWRGDITKLEVDAIVNAANNSLLGGLGVDGAIHEAAGNFLYEECKTLQGCDTGDAKITGGYKLPSKYVIHTVGPKGEKPTLLRSCYEKCLNVLLENKLRTIAFPCISTGVYGYPQDSAANVALKTVRNFLETHSSLIDRVIFCLFLEKDFEIYETMMQLYFPVQ